MPESTNRRLDENRATRGAEVKDKRVNHRFSTGAPPRLAYAGRAAARRKRPSSRPAGGTRLWKTRSCYLTSGALS